MLVAYALPLTILVHIGERVYEWAKARKDFRRYESARLAYSDERMARIHNCEI